MPIIATLVAAAAVVLLAAPVRDNSARDEAPVATALSSSLDGKSSELVVDGSTDKRLSVVPPLVVRPQTRWTARDPSLRNGDLHLHVGVRH